MKKKIRRLTKVNAGFEYFHATLTDSRVISRKAGVDFQRKA